MRTFRTVRRRDLGEITVESGRLFLGELHHHGCEPEVPAGRYPVQVTHCAQFDSDTPSPYSFLAALRVKLSEQPAVSRERVGLFGCDAASLIVCDPQVGVGGILPADFDEQWDALCELILASDALGAALPGGVYVSTGADGRYDIYLERDAAGAPVAITVDGGHFLCGDSATHGVLEARSAEQEQADTDAYQAVSEADEIARRAFFAAQDAAR